ncbi:MAG TPA: hypothetical protein VH600_06065 [Burkholderiales bacterium]
MSGIGSGIAVKDVYRRAVVKAAEVLGGAQQLATRLDLSVGTVRMLMGGKVEVPPRVFLLAVDIISTYGDRPSAVSEEARSGD